MAPSDIAPSTSPPVARLVEAFHRLPGIGPKSAQRLTYHLIRMPHEEAQEFASAIIGVKEKVVLCEICANLSEATECDICGNRSRDREIICVVEEPLDVIAIERARVYAGLFHVLHGVISPVNGIGPNDLKLRELLERLRDGVVTEVIVATNPNLEGEATAMYIQQLISPLGVKVTRLARGLPSGSDIEYADDSTLAHALESRTEVPAKPDYTDSET
ncbi:MAG: recombination protein RecR [Acidimicrobiaceae bacterium]|nr:recombination protein RecR [Acidimicrobiaceae bacterium]|tara:strand:+ start:19 stop:669 length:651 start_codon:yes stop_codon:yes gene_type:complete